MKRPHQSIFEKYRYLFQLSSSVLLFFILWISIILRMNADIRERRYEIQDIMQFKQSVIYYEIDDLNGVLHHIHLLNRYFDHYFLMVNSDGVIVSCMMDIEDFYYYRDLYTKNRIVMEQLTELNYVLNIEYDVNLLLAPLYSSSFMLEFDGEYYYAIFYYYVYRTSFNVTCPDKLIFAGALFNLIITIVLYIMHLRNRIRRIAELNILRSELIS